MHFEREDDLTPLQIGLQIAGALLALAVVVALCLVSAAYTALLSFRMVMR